MQSPYAVVNLVEIEFDFETATVRRQFDVSNLGDAPLFPFASTGLVRSGGYIRLYALDVLGRAWLEDLDSPVMLTTPAEVLASCSPDLRSLYAALREKARKN